MTDLEAIRAGLFPTDARPDAHEDRTQHMAYLDALLDAEWIEEWHMHRILLEPDRDDVRLEFAAWLRENERTVECDRCWGNGGESKYPVDDPTKKLSRGPCWYSCPVCSGTGRASNRFRDRGESIEVGCEIERSPSFRAPEVDPLRTRERELIAVGRAAGWWGIEGLRKPTILEDGRIQWVWDNPDGRHYGITATIRRGFPDTLTLPAAALRPELARAVFSRWPVMGCVLRDKEPHHGPVAGHGLEWSWCLTARGRVEFERSAVGPIFGRLKGGYPWQRTSMVFPSREAALSALSAAVATYCRRLVGLPALAASKQQAASDRGPAPLHNRLTRSEG